MTSQEDWTLPGFQNDPSGDAYVVAAFKFAYSTLSNPARLEAPFYIPWTKIFMALTHDLTPEILVGPQFRIFKNRQDFRAANTSTDTQPGKEPSLIPDCVALGVSLTTKATSQLLKIPQDYPPVGEWDTTGVILWHPFVIREDKSIPSRHYASVIPFREDLEVTIAKAKKQVMNQAIIACNSSEGTGRRSHELALVVTSGEWWEFLFADSDDYRGESLVAVRDDSDDDEMVEYRPRAAQKTLGEDIRRYKELSRQRLFYDDVETAEPASREWSGLLRYGTPASNQCMYLIHRKLQEMRDTLQIDAAEQIQELEREGDLEPDLPKTYEEFEMGIDLDAQDVSMDVDSFGDDPMLLGDSQPLPMPEASSPGSTVGGLGTSSQPYTLSDEDSEKGSPEESKEEEEEEEDSEESEEEEEKGEDSEESEEEEEEGEDSEEEVSEDDSDREV